jgi:hypothetical protein
VPGDTAQTPRFIATVQRRGYRFLAPVVEDAYVMPTPAAPVPPVVLQVPTGEPAPGVREGPGATRGDPGARVFL